MTWCDMRITHTHTSHTHTHHTHTFFTRDSHSDSFVYLAQYSCGFLVHFPWWVLQHCIGFARLVWGRLRVHRAFIYSDSFVWLAQYSCGFLAHPFSHTHPYVWHDNERDVGIVCVSLLDVWRHFSVCCSLLQCVAVCCGVLQCVAVCCSVWQVGIVCASWADVWRHFSVCYSVL